MCPLPPPSRNPASSVFLCARRVDVLRVTFPFDPLSYVGRAVRQRRATEFGAGEKADASTADDGNISKVEHQLAPRVRIQNRLQFRGSIDVTAEHQRHDVTLHESLNTKRH